MLFIYLCCLFFLFFSWTYSKDINVSAWSKTSCALYSDNISEIYHIRGNANTNDRKCDGTMREPRGISFLTGIVYFPLHAQRSGTSYSAEYTSYCSVYPRVICFSKDQR